MYSKIFLIAAIAVIGSDCEPAISSTYVSKPHSSFYKYNILHKPDYGLYKGVSAYGKSYGYGHGYATSYQNYNLKSSGGHKPIYTVAYPSYGHVYGHPSYGHAYAVSTVNSNLYHEHYPAHSAYLDYDLHPYYDHDDHYPYYYSYVEPHHISHGAYHDYYHH